MVFGTKGLEYWVLGPSGSNIMDSQGPAGSAGQRSSQGQFRYGLMV